MLTHWNSNPQVDNSLHSWHTIPIPNQPVFVLSHFCCMLSGEATSTNFIVFVSIRLRLESTNQPDLRQAREPLLHRCIYYLPHPSKYQYNYLQTTETIVSYLVPGSSTFNWTKKMFYNSDLECTINSDCRSILNLWSIFIIEHLFHQRQETIKIYLTLNLKWR